VIQSEGDTVYVEVSPMNWFGVALILLAVVFLAVDLIVTNHGLPTFVGVVALVLGVLTVLDVASPYSGMSLIVLVALTVLAVVVLVAGSSEAFAARGRSATTGAEGMIGEVGVVREPVGAGSPGWVLVHGERWQATVAVAPEDAYERDHEQVIGVGRRVQVVGFRDGKVMVLPFEPAAFEHSPES